MTLKALCGSCIWDIVTIHVLYGVYSHKGIATRSFSKNWQLGEDVEVESVDYKDGLLTVVLEKFVPEEKKKKIWFSEKKGSLKGSK